MPEVKPPSFLFLDPVYDIMQSYVVCFVSFGQAIGVRSSCPQTKYFTNAILSALILKLFSSCLFGREPSANHSIGSCGPEGGDIIGPNKLSHRLILFQTALRLRRFPFSKHKIDALGSEIRFSFRTTKKAIIVLAGEGANVPKWTRIAISPPTRRAWLSPVSSSRFSCLPSYLLAEAEDDTRADLHIRVRNYGTISQHDS
ncbi:hypothetical protein EDB86DRAFT_2391145 [Lactarius hatsudake]|nr:hypothetical protein EDB86DRAFT_2391145 [Lactarius hatsudake]